LKSNGHEITRHPPPNLSKDLALEIVQFFEMKLSGTWLVAVLLGWANLAEAQLQLLTNAPFAAVFGSGARAIELRWRNLGSERTNAQIHARIFQTSSATAAQAGEVAGKTLCLLPHQTILETAQLNFPAVKAETKFLVQWLEDSNHLIGTTSVWVYPTNLLAELKPLLGEGILGVLDPDHELAPALKQNGVTFLDLGETPLAEFSGRLAILGPFSAKAQMPADLTRQIKVLAKRNVAVVWLLPPADRQDPLLPSFYTVPTGTHAVVIAQADMVSKLAENPQSQLHLIHFCKLALKPVSPALPDLTLQP
jgi:hypothetical protein